MCHLLPLTAGYFFSSLLNKCNSIAFDKCSSAPGNVSFPPKSQGCGYFTSFFCHTTEFEVMVTSLEEPRFQKKLLEAELWLSRLSPPKLYDWSTRKKGPIRDHLAKKLSIAFTLVLFGLLLTSAESKDGFCDEPERGTPSRCSFIWHCESTSARVRQPL